MIFSNNFRHHRCQTYEGGIAGEPGSEAHGGYVPLYCDYGFIMTFFLLVNYL